MKPAPAKIWRLHLGVHKTATTHLQNTLALQREHLRARGVDFIPMPEIRGRRIPDLRRRNLLTWFPNPLVAGEIERKSAPLRSGAPAVVMSEEDWLGPSQDLLLSRPYPSLGRRVGALGSLASGADVELFLSIRSWDGLLVSTYAHVLRYLPVPGGFDGVRSRLLASPPSWVEVIRRVRNAVPRAPLTIWRYEDYRSHDREIMSAVCGCDIGDPPEIPDPNETKAPCAEVIAKTERLPLDMPLEERRRKVVEWIAAQGEGTRFSPFPDEEKTLLRERYRSDLEQLANLDGVKLLRFT